MSVIRRLPDATKSTALVYYSLHSIAREKGGADFETNLDEVGRRAMATRRTVTPSLELLRRKRLIDKKRTSHGLRVRLLRVVK